MPDNKKDAAGAVALFAAATLLKAFLLAPGLYHSTDFEVHRNWLAVTHTQPLKRWYWEDTSEWTLDYPPVFGLFQWILSQVAVFVEPDLVKITPSYEPSTRAIYFQRLSVMAADVTLLFGVLVWCRGGLWMTGSAASVSSRKQGKTESSALAMLVLFSAGLMLVDHVHFQYNGFLLGLLLLSMGLIKHGRVLVGGATFAFVLMLKHLFLSLAPLYFVLLLRGYCWGLMSPRDFEDHTVDGCGSAADGCTSGVDSVAVKHEAITEERKGASHNVEQTRQARFFLGRLVALGAVVLGVFATSLGPLCVSDGWNRGACLRQMSQLFARLFPFDRGLVHAYWAPNVWAIYLFADRALLAALKAAGAVDVIEGTASTTGGLVQSEVMGFLPAVPAWLCLVLSLLACSPALLRAWQRPSARVLEWGVVHCSLSAFLVGFHVHEKALLVPAVVSSLAAFSSTVGARLYMRLSFLACFAVFPLIPGPELRIFKVMIMVTHIALASSVLTAQLPIALPDASSFNRSSSPRVDKAPSPALSRTHCGEAKAGSASSSSGTKEHEAVRNSDLCTLIDKIYAVGAVSVFMFAEIVHPCVFSETLPFLPLMAMSVYGALGIVACWVSSVAVGLSTT